MKHLKVLSIFITFQKMADFDFSGATYSTSEEEMVLWACLSSTASSSSDADDDYLQRRTTRSCWIRDWLSRRSSRGSHAFLHGELRTEDANAYRNFIRMDEDTFELLLGLVQEDLKKQDTTFRKAIPVREKLAVTLRFLATGESLTSLAYQTRLSLPFLSFAIPEVCKAIYRRLGRIHLKVSSFEFWDKQKQTKFLSFFCLYFRIYFFQFRVSNFSFS